LGSLRLAAYHGLKLAGFRRHWLLSVATLALAQWGSGCVPAAAYEIEAAYTADILHNMSGGLERGTRYLDNLDVTLELDLEALWDGPGAVFLYGMYNNGTTFSDELVGDLQVVSNIDAPQGFRVFEAWYEIGGEGWSLRSGLYDLNSEFDASETGGLFLNSSHGIGAEIGQTGENGPSIFPVSSLAVRAEVKNDRLTARFAVLDGVPGDPADSSSNRIKLDSGEGALLAAEMDVALGSAGRIWTGYWRYTADFERPFSSGAEDGNDGWYVGMEHEVRIGGLDGALFARYGRANEDLNPIEDYLGAGIVVDNLLPWRPSDQLGLAIASAGVGIPYREFVASEGDQPGSRETTIELTWRMVVSDLLTIQPDLQWVIDPAASEVIDDAVVAGVRVEFTL